MDSPAPPRTSTTSTPFFRLSAELRNRVYALATPPSKVNVNKWYRLPGLLRTCKQIYEESVQLYYHAIEFRFSSLYACVGWLSRLSQRNKRALSSVRLETASECFQLHCCEARQGIEIDDRPGLNPEDELFQRWTVHTARRRLKGLVEDLDPEVVKVDKLQFAVPDEILEENPDWLDDVDDGHWKVWVNVKGEEEGWKKNEFDVSPLLLRW